MADEILSTLGFEVSSALQALEQLDGSLAKLQTRFQGAAQAAGLMSQSSSGLDKFGASAKSNLENADQASKRLTLSWQTMGRVVATQMVVRSLSAIRNGLEEAFDEASKFQIKMGEISTIAPDGTNIANLSKSLVDLSSARSFALDDVSKSYYQTLSNGITDASEALKFLDEAAKFGKATNSDLFQSVNLLSGALKSYGMNVSQTAHVSNVMFEAIRAGRITASELGDTFGRVGPRAAMLNNHS